MKVTVHKIDQRTDEWKQLRLGRLTGSRADDMLATIKSGEAAARRDYRIELVVERLTGRPAESGFVSDDMKRGIELEPVARAAYESRTGNLVDESGFIAADDLMVGCSVDGHVGVEGIVELKCPKSATMLRYLRDTERFVKDYAGQVTHNLWVTGALWCDLVAFDNRMPDGLQMVVVRVSRGAVKIDEYETKALAFLAEVDSETEELRRMGAA